MDKLIWLGHATFLIDLGGTRLLLDPCLTNPPMFERRTKLPFGIGEIHPDLSRLAWTLRPLRCPYDKCARRYTYGAVPAGLTKYTKKLNLKCVEMEWHQSFKIGEIEVVFLPAYHWHSRFGFDKNMALWGVFDSLPWATNILLRRQRI